MLKVSDAYHSRIGHHTRLEPNLLKIDGDVMSTSCTTDSTAPS